jgi:hypothetical protein
VCNQPFVRAGARPCLDLFCCLPLALISLSGRGVLRNSAEVRSVLRQCQLHGRIGSARCDQEARGELRPGTTGLAMVGCVIRAVSGFGQHMHAAALWPLVSWLSSMGEVAHKFCSALLVHLLCVNGGQCAASDCRPMPVLTLFVGAHVGHVQNACQGTKAGVAVTIKTRSRSHPYQCRLAQRMFQVGWSNCCICLYPGDRMLSTRHSFESLLWC